MSKKIEGTPEAWEGGSLGREEEYVRVSKNIDEAALNDAAGLQPISIRLQKSLIEDFKMIADINGIGYQPLIRQVLKRFADAEKNAFSVRSPLKCGRWEMTTMNMTQGTERDEWRSANRLSP